MKEWFQDGKEYRYIGPQIIVQDSVLKYIWHGVRTPWVNNCRTPNLDMMQAFDGKLHVWHQDYYTDTHGSFDCTLLWNWNGWNKFFEEVKEKPWYETTKTATKRAISIDDAIGFSNFTDRAHYKSTLMWSAQKTLERPSKDKCFILSTVTRHKEETKMTELQMCDKVIKMWTWLAGNPGKGKSGYERATGTDLEQYHAGCPACEYYREQNHSGCAACPLKSCYPRSAYDRWAKNDHSGAIEILTAFIERRAKLLCEKHDEEKLEKIGFDPAKNYVFVYKGGEPFILSSYQGGGFQWQSFENSGQCWTDPKDSGQEALDYVAKSGEVYEFTGCIPAMEFFLERRKGYEAI
jgi:hypothetical protein